MKVLTVGFFKTGTRSVNAALDMLGYKVSDVERNYSELREDWLAFVDGARTADDLKWMYKGYDAAGDSPAFFYWKEFLEAFPDVKLILTTRDIDDWIVSFRQHVKVLNESDLAFPLGIFSRKARKYFEFHNRVDEPMFGTLRRGISIKPSIALHDDSALRRGLKRHVDDVIENAPRDQLLVYNVTEGWQPLCSFLGKPVPDVPFPHLNKKASIARKRLTEDKHMLLMYREMYRNLALIALCISLVFFLLLMT